jgi:hypothetical protein
MELADFLGIAYRRADRHARSRSAGVAGSVLVTVPERRASRSRGSSMVQNSSAAFLASVTSFHTDASSRSSEESREPSDGPDTDHDAADQSAPSLTAWEDTTLHREETWWVIPSTKIVAMTEVQRASLSALTDSNSYHDVPQLTNDDLRPKRRVLGFALPLMESRLQIDGTWVLIVRHDRGAPKALVRRRHQEALHLLRHIDGATHLPSVSDLRELLNIFKRRHPEHHFDDTAVRRRLAAQQGFAMAMPRRSGLGGSRRPDDDDRVINSRLSQKNLQRLRPGTDAVDELDVSAVSSVCDMRTGTSERRPGGSGGAGLDTDADDLVTLVDIGAAFPQYGASFPGSRRRMAARDQQPSNSVHYSYDAISVVPWNAAGASSVAPSTTASPKRSSSLFVPPHSDGAASPGGQRVPLNAIGVSQADEGESGDDAEPAMVTGYASSGTVSRSSSGLDGPRDSFRSISAAQVDHGAMHAPQCKVKIRAKNALHRDCRCDVNTFCGSGRRTGDVFATVSGHCIVVHPDGSGVGAGAFAASPDGRSTSPTAR